MLAKLFYCLFKPSPPPKQQQQQQQQRVEDLEIKRIGENVSKCQTGSRLAVLREPCISYIALHPFLTAYRLN